MTPSTSRRLHGHAPSKAGPAAAVPGAVGGGTPPTGRSLLLQGANTVQAASSQLMPSVPQRDRQGGGSGELPGALTGRRRTGGQTGRQTAPASSRTSAHADCAARSRAGTGGDQLGSGPRGAFPFHSYDGPLRPVLHTHPTPGQTGGAPRQKQSHLGRPQVLVSSEQSWAPGRPPRPGSTEPGKRWQRLGRARAEGQARGGSGRALHGPGAGAAALGRRTSAVPPPSSEGADGLLGDRDGPQGRSSPSACVPAGVVRRAAPHAEPRVAGAGPSRAEPVVPPRAAEEGTEASGGRCRSAPGGPLGAGGAAQPQSQAEWGGGPEGWWGRALWDSRSLRAEGQSMGKKLQVNVQEATAKNKNKLSN